MFEPSDFIQTWDWRVNAVSLRSMRLLWLTDEEMFVRFGGDNPGPAFEVSLFEEIFGVLAGVFDLVEIGLSDG